MKRRKVQDFNVLGSTVIAQRAAAPLRFASVKSTHKGLQTPQLSFYRRCEGRESCQGHQKCIHKPYVGSN